MKNISKSSNTETPKREPIVTSYITYLPLNNGLFAMVDTGDLDEVKSHTWCVSYHGGKPYAVTRQKKTGKMLHLHRLIMGAKKGDKRIIDHINRFTLDCRRANMRFCTTGENRRNSHPNKHSSRFKGVTKLIRKNGFRWRANICINKKMIHLGVFDSEVDAAVAYDNAVRGVDKHAYLNFPEKI